MRSRKTFIATLLFSLVLLAITAPSGAAEKKPLPLGQYHSAWRSWESSGT
jgi:hypothetical protein